jgi:hypothetical protein
MLKLYRHHQITVIKVPNSITYTGKRNQLRKYNRHIMTPKERRLPKMENLLFCVHVCVIIFTLKRGYVNSKIDMRF